MLDTAVNHINNRFVEEEGLLDWFDTELAIYYSKFAVTKYSDKLFQALTIPLPNTMGRAVVKRRAEYLAGRYCAFKAFEQYDIHSPSIGIGEHRNPLWPNGFVGSISHTNDRALAIVGRDSIWLGVGIDIENTINQGTLNSIQNQILCDDERQLLANNVEAATIFTLCFSLKESFFKAVFPQVGHYFDFYAISILDIDMTQRTISFRLNQDLSLEFCQGLVFTGFFLLPTENTIVTMVTLRSNCQRS